MKKYLFVVAAMMLADPWVAAAAEPTPEPAGGKPAAKPKGTRTKPAVSAPAATMENGVLKFDPMTIEGRIEKPIPIHTRERTTPVFQDLVPEESFLGGILDAADEEPF